MYPIENKENIFGEAGAGGIDEVYRAIAAAQDVLPQMQTFATRLCDGLKGLFSAE